MISACKDSKRIATSYRFSGIILHHDDKESKKVRKSLVDRNEFGFAKGQREMAMSDGIMTK